MRALALFTTMLALATGCAHASRHQAAARVDELTAGGARFRVAYWPEDAKAARQVAAAVRAAAPRVTRWGDIAVPITITVHPSHAALEDAVRREGYAWLRAWARYSTIDVQSPRTWSLFGASDAEVTELLTHELTHCAMYQHAATEFNWPYKAIPLWFREGLASVTAEQGYRRGKLDALFRFYAQSAPGSGDGIGISRARVALGPTGGEGDPIGDPEPLYQDRSEIVYGAAHHAFKFLLDRYGEERVRRILDLMAKGRQFPAAFEEAVGLSEPEFAADFRRFVVWQGWAR